MLQFLGKFIQLYGRWTCNAIKFLSNAKWTTPAIDYQWFFFSFSYWYFVISFLKKICALFVCNSRFIYLGETFSPLQLVGAVVTLVAIYMVNYRNVVEWSMPMINMGQFKIWMKGMQCSSECCGMKHMINMGWFDIWTKGNKCSFEGYLLILMTWFEDFCSMYEYKLVYILEWINKPFK